MIDKKIYNEICKMQYNLELLKREDLNVFERGELLDNINQGLDSIDRRLNNDYSILANQIKISSAILQSYADKNKNGDNGIYVEESEYEFFIPVKP